MQEYQGEKVRAAIADADLKALSDVRIRVPGEAESYIVARALSARARKLGKGSSASVWNTTAEDGYIVALTGAPKLRTGFGTTWFNGETVLAGEVIATVMVPEVQTEKAGSFSAL